MFLAPRNVYIYRDGFFYAEAQRRRVKLRKQDRFRIIPSSYLIRNSAPLRLGVNKASANTTALREAQIRPWSTVKQQRL